MVEFVLLWWVVRVVVPPATLVRARLVVPQCIATSSAPHGDPNGVAFGWSGSRVFSVSAQEASA